MYYKTNTTMKAFIARDKDGDLYLYTPNSPTKLGVIWQLTYKSGYTTFKIDNALFPEVKWEDKEPTEINIEIVNKH